MPADNTAALAAATRRRAESTRQRARIALQDLDRAGAPITYASVAHAAGISRSLLYPGEWLTQVSWVGSRRDGNAECRDMRTGRAVYGPSQPRWVMGINQPRDASDAEDGSLASVCMRVKAAWECYTDL